MPKIVKYGLNVLFVAKCADPKLWSLLTLFDTYLVVSKIPLTAKQDTQTMLLRGWTVSFTFSINYSWRYVKQ